LFVCLFFLQLKIKMSSKKNRLIGAKMKTLMGLGLGVWFPQYAGLSLL
jgi:hypothetical protein